MVEFGRLVQLQRGVSFKPHEAFSPAPGHASPDAGDATSEPLSADSNPIPTKTPINFRRMPSSLAPIATHEKSIGVQVLPSQ